MIDNDDIECGNHCQRNPVGDFLRKFIFQQDNIQKPNLDLASPKDYGLKTKRFDIIFSDDFSSQKQVNLNANLYRSAKMLFI